MSFLTTNPNRHLITIPTLNGVVNSATGSTGNLSNALSIVLGYINSNTNSASFNRISAFTGSNINVTNNLNLCNTYILYNGSFLLTNNTLNTRGYTAFQIDGFEYMRLSNTGLNVHRNLIVNQHLNVNQYLNTPLININGISTLGANFLNNSTFTAFSVNNTESMRLTNIGLGINIAAPTGKLHVVGNTIFEGGNMKLISPSALLIDADTVLKKNIVNMPGFISFQVNLTEEMRLKPDGLGIMTTTPRAPLHVNGDTIVQGTLYVSSFGSVLPPSIGDIYADGNMYANGIMYPSDPKLKDNVRPYTLRGGLPQPVEFTWKSTGKRDIGVLADDVQTIEPLCAHTLANGNLSVDYPKLVVLCLAELKELRATVEVLREEIQQLRQ